MSIYSDVLKEIGETAPYPSRKDFTKFHGYARGNPIGMFGSVKEAKEAGAISTEQTFDEEGYGAAKAAYAADQKKVVDTWYARVRAEYSDLTDTVFSLVHRNAYEDGHSSGYGEVEIYIDKYADFAREVLKMK